MSEMDESEPECQCLPTPNEVRIGQPPLETSPEDLDIMASNETIASSNLVYDDHGHPICQIHCLPPEILSRIFNHAIQGEPLLWHTGNVISSFKAARFDGCDRYELMRVCHHWQNIILGTPSYWVNITDGVRAVALEAALDRSKALPLTITRVVTSSREPPLIARHLPRVKELGIYIHGKPRLLHCIHESLNRSADNLEALFLVMRVPLPYDQSTLSNACTLPPDFLSAQAPKLRRISLESYVLDWRSPLLNTSLTHLEILIPTNAHSLPSPGPIAAAMYAGFFDCLARLPSLLVLVLMGCIPVHPSSLELVDNPSPIHLAYLQRLAIDDRASSVIDLMRRLTAPACTYLELKVTNVVGHNVQQMFERLAQILRKPSIGMDIPSRPVSTVRVSMQEIDYRLWLSIKGWSIDQAVKDGYPVFHPEVEPSFNLTLNIREESRQRLWEAAFMDNLCQIVEAIPSAGVHTLSLELPYFRRPTSSRPLVHALRGWDSVCNLSLDCGDYGTQMAFGALGWHGRLDSSLASATTSDIDNIFLPDLKILSMPEAILTTIPSFSSTPSPYGDLLVPKLRARKENNFLLRKLYIVRSRPGFPRDPWLKNLKQVVSVSVHVETKSGKALHPSYDSHSSEPPARPPTR
ncbi:hypothetical protein EVG20_g10876 [Dentipellis fragilis]|uniref:Uncharacterized protein n=1 Tax=Dentipellis fragilis TaxID=205917 RepID=A0A4Y9XT31_9AGAM|nr:hypothetical protein EVG20_g10876 [Dentipellis fragilis]